MSQFKITQKAKTVFVYQEEEFETYNGAASRAIADEIFDKLYAEDPEFKANMEWDMNRRACSWTPEEMRRLFNPLTCPLSYVGSEFQAWFASKLKEYVSL